MTFEQFQDQRGRNTSNEADYKEYMAFLEQSGLLNKAASKKQLSKAAAPQKPITQIQAPPLEGAMLTDGSGVVGQATASGGLKGASKVSQRTRDMVNNLKGNKAFLGTEDINRMPAPEAPGSAPGFFDEGGAWDQTSFTGDAKGVATAGMMAMQTANSQTASQAIMGGAMTGMSVGSMLTGAAAGPVGAAVGVGSALMGLANASSQRRKREKAAEEAKKEQERLMKRQEKLRSLENYNNRRQRAYESLMGAFR